MIALGGSCNTHTGLGFQRLALLPANLLVTDPALAWLGAAVPVVLQSDLSSAPNSVSAAVLTSSEAFAFGASEMVETTVERNAGQLAFETSLRNLQTERNEADETESGGVISSLDAIARSIDRSAVPFSTRNDSALHAYVAALEATEMEARISGLQRAVQLDPNFGAAQTGLILSEAQVGFSQLPGAVANAKAYRQHFTPLDRARFDSALARITGAPVAQQSDAAQAVVKLAPNDMEALSLLGTAHFLQDDGDGGKRYLGRAYELSAGNAALRSELAQGLFETKQFRAAEALFAQSSNAQAEVAFCALLEGDAGRAQKTLVQAKASPMAEAEWLASTSTLPKAVTVLEGVPWASDDAKAVASAQRGLWQFAIGDVAAAGQSVTEGTQTASSATAKQLVAPAVIIVQAGSPDQLRAKVAAANAPESGKETVLGYGLFLYRDYAGAADEFQKLLKASGNTDLHSRAMLASCYEHLNRNGNIREIKVQPFVPNISGTDPFAAFAFAEMRRLLVL